jgi:predicted XRE-type DNA-binding protein
MAARASKRRGRGRKVTKVTRSSGNVFRDLGFGLEEAEHLRIRSDLMTTLQRVIDDRSLTQARAATLLGVSQPRVSDLVRGKIERFSIDALVEMLGRADVRVNVVVSRAGARALNRPARPPTERYKARGRANRG